MLTAFLILLAIEVPVARVADDAKAIDRVAAASKHDMPVDLLRRMLTEDIELLRGRQAGGGYEYASYERLEANRSSDAFSIEENKDPEKLTKLEVKSSWVYRLVIELPSRRMLVTKNRRAYIDHVDIEYIPERGGAAKQQRVDVRAFVEAGTLRNIDFDEIAKQATVRVYARTEKDSGYSNIVLSLIHATVSDDPKSPYADAIASAKAILRALDHDDPASMRAMAQRMMNDLQPSGGQPSSASGGQPSSAVQVTASQTAAEAGGALPNLEVLTELQAIEDLLTGNENERRQGVDRLHQLIRKLRPIPK